MHTKATLSFKFELKTLSNREFEGHGSIFGNVDLGGDVVMPGAFTMSLAQHKAAGTLPQMFWMHQPDQVPGKWLAMAEDDDGLYVKGELADTTLGNDTRTLVQMKAVRGLSIGYKTVESEWRGDDRMLKEVDLWEVSLVSLAMNPLAKIQAAKARLSHDGEYVPTSREFEQHLRDVGCSRKVARMLIAKIFDDDPRWDAGGPGETPETVDSEAAELMEALAKWTGSTVEQAFRT